MAGNGQLTTYEQALEFLYNRINYERVQSTAYSSGDFKLNRMRALLELMGNPQLEIPAVHIAGTKGKGSTAVMVASVLQTAGYRTGLFTSPHISRFEERMSVDGRMPTPAEVIELVNSLLGPVAQLDQELGGMSPTYFEITTVMAWLYFLRQKSQIAVLEVGLGGRLDATNVCRPEVCIITTISRDHTHLLGSEVHQIAREKAGIIKPLIPVISGVMNSPAKETILQICRERSAPVRQLGEDFGFQFHFEGDQPKSGNQIHQSNRTVSFGFRNHPEWETALSRVGLSLLGEHQGHNAALALAAVLELSEKGWQITPIHARQGISNVRWPARIEVLCQSPLTIVDSAHNWASISALIRTLDLEFPDRRRILVIAATQDKDVRGMLRQLLPQFNTVILTCYQSNPRSVPVEEMLALVRTISDQQVHMYQMPQQALQAAQKIAGNRDLICVTGSFFIAAELRDGLVSNVAAQ